MGRRRLGPVAGLVAVLTLMGACAAGTPGDRVAAGPTAGPSPAAPSIQPTPTPTTGGAGGPATGSGSSSPSTPPACPQGKYQREIEQAINTLGGFGQLVADGAQTEADCAVIKKFQRRYGLSPVDGNAGPQTWGAARRLVSTDTSQCGGGSGLTVCVDLTNQTTYARKNGKIVLAPTVVRTGMNGFETPAGTFQLTRKSTREWSVPYKVWLPYFQHFYDGMGFHETTSYLYNSFGSHGCINMLSVDVKALWKLTSVGTTVVLYGRRPGT